MYHITEYSKQQAKKLNVKIKPSTNPMKKIDVFKNNEKIATIGDIRYSDYPTYMITKGKEYANSRRRLYRIRHKNDMNKTGTNGYYANKILW
jgi:hypothetical protein